MATRKRNAAQLGRARANSSLGIISISAAIVIAAVLITQNSKPAPAVVQAAPVVGEFDSIKVPVPSSFVPAGTKLKDVRFKKVSFPKHQVPQKAITDVTPYIEAVTVAALPANLPLFRDNISFTAGAQNPVIERIPEGMRAMTVRVDATSAVEGWAGTGSVVDVLLVTKSGSSVVAEKVKILSAERSVTPVNSTGSPNIPSTVTLLVSQEQCLAINTAINIGKIAFALRSTQDGGRWRRTSFTAEKLKGGSVSKEQKNTITGYVEVKNSAGQNSASSFALSDGDWIKTEIRPRGFFPNQEAIEGAEGGAAN